MNIDWDVYLFSFLIFNLENHGIPKTKNVQDIYSKDCMRVPAHILLKQGKSDSTNINILEQRLSVAYAHVQVISSTK